MSPRIAELDVRDRPLAPVGRPDARRQLDVQLGIDPSLIGEPAWVGEGTRPKPIDDPELYVVIKRCSRNRFPAVHGRPRSLRGATIPRLWECHHPRLRSCENLAYISLLESFYCPDVSAMLFANPWNLRVRQTFSAGNWWPEES
jgi:hypothetical protein